MRTATGQRSQDHPSIDSLSKNNIGLEHQWCSFWCLTNTYTGGRKKCMSVQLACNCTQLTLQVFSDSSFPRDIKLPNIRIIGHSLVFNKAALLWQYALHVWYSSTLTSQLGFVHDWRIVRFRIKQSYTKAAFTPNMSRFQSKPVGRLTLCPASKWKRSRATELKEKRATLSWRSSWNK